MRLKIGILVGKWLYFDFRLVVKKSYGSTSYLTIYQLAHYCTELKSGETTKWPHLQFLLLLLFFNNRFILNFSESCVRSRYTWILCSPYWSWTSRAPYARLIYVNYGLISFVYVDMSLFFWLLNVACTQLSEKLSKVKIC
jgi:hypothetical protein